jgi:hypothetical protein
MKNNRWTIISFSLLLLLLALHLPFLNSDPDINLGYYRDTFNGEGLSVIQLRNYINHGYLSITECDKLLKLPLFNLVLFLPFQVMGTDVIVGRITVLVLVIILVVLFEWISPVKYIVPVLVPIVLSQYFIFQFSHFVMADMIAIGMILISIAFLARAVTDEKTKRRSIFFASLFCALAYYIKVLYLYSLLLVPFSLLLFMILPGSNIRWRDMFYSIVWMVLFAAIYFTAWYLPNAPAYNYFMKPQLNDMIGDHGSISQLIYKNVRNNLLAPQSRMFIAFSFIAILFGLLQWSKSVDLKFRAMFIASLLWVLLESHKLIYGYLPTRYGVSLFFSIGLLASVVISHFLFSSETNVSKRTIAVLILATFIFVNGFDYYGLYSRRQSSMAEMNDYMKRTIKDPDRVVMGLWAPAITWKSKSHTVPVSWYYDFMNNKNILTGYKPIAIISEPDEADSGGRYMHQDIDLNAISDSVKHFNVGKWNLNLYWINSGKVNWNGMPRN